MSTVSVGHYAVLNNAVLRILRNIKRYIFPLLMGIIVRKLVKMKGYIHAKDAIYQISKTDNLSKTWYSLSKGSSIFYGGRGV